MTKMEFFMKMKQPVYGLMSITFCLLINLIYFNFRTVENYKNKVECFVDQYSNYYSIQVKRNVKIYFLVNLKIYFK